MGTFNVTLIATDPLGLADTVTTTATVKTRPEGVNDAKGLVDGLLTAGKINKGVANSLSKKLDAAIASFNRGGPAVNQLNAVLNEIDDLIANGVITQADADPLIALINGIIASI